MKLIIEWLNNDNKNYYIGKSIYQSVSKDTLVIAQLNKGKSAGNMQLLIDEMTKLIKVDCKVEKEASTFIDNDIVLAALNNEWKEKYARMNSIRYAMDAFNGDNSKAVIEKRHEMAKEILSLEKEIEIIWAKRDYYKANGKLPDSANNEKPLPTNAVELGKLIESIKKYIRRYKSTKDINASHAEKYQYYLSKYETLTGTTYVQKN